MGTLGLAITLVVRLYDNGTLADADRAVAIDTAATILLASNIPTSWPGCQPPSAGRVLPFGSGSGDGSEEQDPSYVIPFGCNRPMGPGELAVRLVRGTTPRHTRGDLPLGYSLVDTARGGGALATIYLDRVEWIAGTTGVDVRVILGRAIAHEIGHLVLGTNAHGEHGLMRAVWSRRTLERNAPGDWLFTPQESADLHRALGRRVPVTESAENIVWGR